ncbi:MAG: phosphatidylinositol mannoside acyltransferase [Nostocoides sp.]
MLAGVPAIADAVTTGGFRAGWSVVRRLPERTAYTVFDAAAVLTHARGGTSIDRLRSNYARVRPELEADALEDLVRAGVRSYLRYWCDAFRLPDLTPDQIRERVRCEGDGPVRADLAAGRPVLAFLGHMGNWDMAGAWCTVDLGPVVTVAERLKPEKVYAEFLAFRERLGMRILPLTGGGNVMAELREALREPIVLPLLADRDLTKGGIPVTLLGYDASVAAGPAALAVATGAALHPVTIHYEPAPDLPSRWRTIICFHPAVTDPATGPTRERVTAMSQACADALSEGIREHLVDWHMMQRIFTADLSPRSAEVPS